MKLDFKFSNLCGTVYKRGNLLFTPDGNSLLSPVGNKVSVYDLVNNTSYTFSFENRKNISKMALSPDSALLITIDEEGRALLVNFKRRVVLHHHNFKEPVRDIQFSPDGRYFAVTHGKHVQLWRTPGFTVEFSPFVLQHTFTGHVDDVTCISWSPDSKFIVTGSKDMTCRIYKCSDSRHSNYNHTNNNNYKNCIKNIKDAVSIDYTVPVMTGHRDTIMGVWFAKDQDTIFSVSKDGALFEWCLTSIILNEEQKYKRRKAADGQAEDTFTIKKWKIQQKHYFMQNHAKVSCCGFQRDTNLLTVGFSSGIFGIYELPEFVNIHSLSMSQQKIDSLAVNNTGEWLAFGCSKLGQLLVWEWQSESQILKQQGHHHDMSCLSYSQDGQYIATGGDDGKVKLWSTQSGFCFVTFNDHTSSITAVEFAKQGQVVFSASMDGTIRAYDLVRYRNFRTFVSPNPMQFGCLAVDPGADIVCAGGLDNFDIYVWSVQTGKLLEVFSGHQGPISSLGFSPDGLLVSGSWDKTVRTWNVFARDANPEVFDFQHEIISVAYRPDGKQIAASTLDGQISFWDPIQAKEEGIIDGRRDIVGGRKSTDKVVAANSYSGKSFHSLSYTADGQCVIAGGNSKYICIYDVLTHALLKRFEISHNLSLDGMNELLNSKNMTEAGAMDLIDDENEEDSDVEERKDKSLPGVQKGDMSVRRTRPEARTKCVKFSPTGRSWAAATTEGLLMYSLDDGITFDPLDLEMDITRDSVLETLEEDKEYLKAFVMAFRLGEKNITSHVYESIPVQDITHVVRQLPTKYLGRVLRFLSTEGDRTTHLKETKQCVLEEENMKSKPFRIEFYLTWVVSILKHHSLELKTKSNDHKTVLRALFKTILQCQEHLSSLCDENLFSLDWVLAKSLPNQLSLPESETVMMMTMDQEEESDVDNDVQMDGLEMIGL